MAPRFTRFVDPHSWRKIALHTWGESGDPSIYGLLEVDLTRANAWIEEARTRSALKVTITHLVGKAIAVAIRERPEVNALMRRGRRLYLRDTVDVFFQVAFDGGENLSGAKIERADEKSVLEIAKELADRAERVRKRRDRDLQKTTSFLERTPESLIGPALRAITFLTYDVGLDLRRFGVPYDQFGSVMVTNVGMFGLPAGFAPLVPFARTPMLLTLGAIQQKPVAVDGRVEVRPVLPIGATLDHRLLDGYQAGKLAKRFREVLEDPFASLGPP